MSDRPCVVLGCGATPTRRHLNGALCAEHAPTPPPPPPPGTTLAERRTRAAEPVDPPGTPTPAPEAAHGAHASPRDPDAAHAYTPNMARGTARAAASAAAPRAGTKRRAVYDAICDAHARGYHGATDLELCRATGLGGNTVRPRRLELVEAGIVVDTGRRRRAGGTDHTVWGPA